MPDAHYEHPRLAAVYDAIDGDRGDLDRYTAMADDLGARRVLDLGWGTGTLALLLSARGVEVIGVDLGDWDRTLRGVHGALRPGGRLVFETRDPADRAWRRWTRAATHRRVEVSGVGAVETWTDLIAVPDGLSGRELVFVASRPG